MGFIRENGLRLRPQAMRPAPHRCVERKPDPTRVVRENSAVGKCGTLVYFARKI